MSIKVRTHSDESYEYPLAVKWHIDDDGHLHVVGESGKGNIATFHASSWAHVEHDGFEDEGVRDAMHEVIKKLTSAPRREEVEDAMKKFLDESKKAGLKLV